MDSENFEYYLSKIPFEEYENEIARLGFRRSTNNIELYGKFAGEKKYFKMALVITNIRLIVLSEEKSKIKGFLVESLKSIDIFQTDFMGHLQNSFFIFSIGLILFIFFGDLGKYISYILLATVFLIISNSIHKYLSGYATGKILTNNYKIKTKITYKRRGSTLFLHEFLCKYYDARKNVKNYPSPKEFSGDSI